MPSCTRRDIRRPARRQATEHLPALLAADLVGAGRPVVVEPGGLIALGAVAVDGDDLAGVGHLAAAAEPVLGVLGRGPVVVAVVVPELVLLDGPVVGEVRPQPGRHPAAAGAAVDAHHVDARLERVAGPERVVGERALADPALDPVIAEVGLERAVDDRPDQLRPAPAEPARAEVAVGPLDRRREPVDHEGVERRVERADKLEVVGELSVMKTVL